MLQVWSIIWGSSDSIIWGSSGDNRNDKCVRASLCGSMCTRVGVGVPMGGVGLPSSEGEVWAFPPVGDALSERRAAEGNGGCL